MKKRNNQKGAATLFVLVAGLFFIAFIIGILVLSSAQRQSQIGLDEETQEIYNQTVQGNTQQEIVPIYSADQLLKMGSKENISISEENGKKYTFSENAQYVLSKDIELEYDGILDLSQYNFDKSGYKVKIKDTSKAEEVYYYYMNEYNYPVTIDGFKYDGLTVQYDGSNNAGYENHSDTTNTWKDLSGNGNDATLNGFSYDTTSGWSNNALNYDGSDDYITIQTNPIYTTEEYTMQFTIETNKTANQALFCNRATVGTGRAQFILSNNIRIDNGTAQWATEYNAEEYNTIDICVVRDATSAKLYINGELAKYTITVGDAEGLHENISTIGASQIQSTSTSAISNLDNYFSGKMYIVNIYNKALTDEEIENNYEAVKENKLSEVEVNAPNLKEGMIPVYYDNGWKKADENNANYNWYNYSTRTRKWANVVTVKQTGTKTRDYYKTAEVGEPIVEEDILAMFVWIPRYAYNIANGYHTAANGTGEIQIKFLKSTTDIYQGGIAVRQVDTNALTNGNKYVVHPAFTADNIGEEITGMWVGKFESSNASSPINNAGITESSNENLKKGLGDGTTKDVTIRANVTSWRWTDAPTMLEVAQTMNDSGNIHGLTTDSDTMMMKNSQWGAVVYLAQSNYGNKQVSGDDTSGIWNNPYNEGYIYATANASNPYGMDNYSTTLTGMAGETRDTGTTYFSKVQAGTKTDNGDSITIKYNNVNLVENNGGPEGTLGDEFTRTYYRYNTANGQKASTTRNIYGIYDMSGGSWEYMASFLSNGTQSYVTTMLAKDAKYIAKYAGEGATSSVEDRTANYEANKDVYGDAVWETSNGANGQYGWNDDYSNFPFLTQPFFLRGAAYDATSYAGVFFFYESWGGGHNNSAFRVVAL